MGFLFGIQLYAIIGGHNFMKLFIKNRQNQKMAVVTEKTNSPKGLVFITHGLGDSKDSPHIKKIARCFQNNHYNVVRFDTTNTFGESDGQFEDANLSTYYQDLEDLIAWSKSQDFYQEPFVLCGHSLGAAASAFYAERYPRKIKGLAPISTVINAELSQQNYSPEELANWKKTGWLTEDWDGQKIRLKWSYMQAKKKYDLLKRVHKLTMPVLMVVGELDDSTGPKQQKILFTKLPGRKEFHIIKAAPHTFRSQVHLNTLSRIMNKWIKSLDK